jgi:Phosphomannomutase
MKAYEYWMKNLPESENSGIEGLSQAEIDERFGGELEFGTAGMRGIIGLGTSLMNLYTVGRATEGLAGYIIDKGGEERGVAIAYDTRRFSKEFALEAALILSGKGIKAYLFEGVRPVPVLSFAVRYLNASAGIMITASHNPKEYNGYKVYGPDGAQMSPEETAAVAAYIKNPAIST